MHFYHTQVKEVNKNEGVLSLHVQRGGCPDDVMEGMDVLLWAVGRRANIGDIGLDKTGVKVDGHGFIKVDEYDNTEVHNVYALGDVTGRKLLTPGTEFRGVVICLTCFLNISCHSSRTQTGHTSIW